MRFSGAPKWRVGVQKVTIQLLPKKLLPAVHTKKEDFVSRTQKRSFCLPYKKEFFVCHTHKRRFCLPYTEIVLYVPEYLNNKMAFLCISIQNQKRKKISSTVQKKNVCPPCRNKERLLPEKKVYTFFRRKKQMNFFSQVIFFFLLFSKICENYSIFGSRNRLRTFSKFSDVSFISILEIKNLPWRKKFPGKKSWEKYQEVKNEMFVSRRKNGFVRHTKKGQS